jgi:hypothetical protein
MKVTIKKNLIVFHNPQDWQSILDQLIQQHGRTIKISWVMRRELGFVVRNYRALVPNEHVRTHGPTMHYEDHVCLDFYNESTHSWFVLKYLNLST